MRTNLLTLVLGLVLVAACTDTLEPAEAVAERPIWCPPDQDPSAATSDDCTFPTPYPTPVPTPKERWNAIVRGATEGSITYGGGDFLYSNANTAFVTQPINGLTVGETLLGAAITVRGPLTGTTQQLCATLMRSNPNLTSTPLHSICVVPTTQMQVYPTTWTANADDVVMAGRSYYWYFNIPAANTVIGQHGYTVMPTL